MQIGAIVNVTLWDPDKLHRDRLTQALQAAGHRVLLVETDFDSSHSLAPDMPLGNILIIDVSHFAQVATRKLRSLCENLRYSSAPTLILCFSTIYRGPRFELEIERLGVRFIYAR
jgi:hypothetical protein